MNLCITRSFTVPVALAMALTVSACGGDQPVSAAEQPETAPREAATAPLEPPAPQDTEAHSTDGEPDTATADPGQPGPDGKEPDTTDVDDETDNGGDIGRVEEPEEDPTDVMEPEFTVEEIADAIVGLPLADAEAWAKDRGLHFRILTSGQPATMDYSPQRVNIDVVDGIVTEVFHIA
ncbi:MAG: hypothetical protein AAGD35_10970 [Actinomycetota bacterium]